jgi:hypothetical protein
MCADAERTPAAYTNPTCCSTTCTRSARCSTGGSFGERIIVDQQWALEAIYAVFDAAAASGHIGDARRALHALRLARFLWDGSATARPRAVALDMMRSCRICFQIGPGPAAASQIRGPRPPPPRDDLQHRLTRLRTRRRPSAPPSPDLLPPGPVAPLMAEVGELAGVRPSTGRTASISTTPARGRGHEHVRRAWLRQPVDPHAARDADGLLAALAHLVKAHRTSSGATGNSSVLRRGVGLRG